MPVQRKVFRIEEFGRSDAQPEGSADESETTLSYGGLVAELKAVRALLEAGRPAGQLTPLAQAEQLKAEIDAVYEAIRRTKREVAGIDAGALGGMPMARVADELGAVVAGTEHATKRILEVAEQIDQAVATLAETLKNTRERELAQDVRGGLGRIFAACNFHDLTGQRVAKVLTTFNAIEQNILRMREIWVGMQAGIATPAVPSAASALALRHKEMINGPKLNGDIGHSSQADIDALFA